jgi:hypothetical protein
MGTIDADNKPDLIDQIERETQGWEIHEATITVDGVLSGDDFTEFGINADALSEHVTLNETFEITPGEPMTHDSFLALLWDLSVPENASVSVKLQVDKNE